MVNRPRSLSIASYPKNKIAYFSEFTRSSSRRLILRLCLGIVVFTVFFLAMQPFIAPHAIAGTTDEAFYTSRAVQTIQFYEGIRSASTFYLPPSIDHPLTAELFIGTSLFITNLMFDVPHNPYSAHPSNAAIDNARTVSLIIGSLGIAILTVFAFEIYLPATIVVLLFLISSPGYLENSLIVELDIFTAVFITISLVCLYYYFVHRRLPALFLGAVFLGLGFGSKTAWDPIVAFFAFMIAIILSALENSRFEKLRNILLTIMIILVTFAVTSTVTLLRANDDVNHVLATMNHAPGTNPVQHYRDSLFALSNLVTYQSLIGPSHNYSIFSQQLPLNIIVYAFSLGIVSIVILTRPSIRNSLEDRMRIFVSIIGLFTIIDLVLTALTFEYGRNYGRFTIYEIFLAVIVIGYVKIASVRVIPIILVSILLLTISVIEYWSFIPNVFQHSGVLAGMVAPGTVGFDVTVGSFLLLVLVGSGIVFSYQVCWMGFRRVKSCKSS